jgi:hypothetical protein
MFWNSLLMQREILTLVVQTISEKWVQFQWPKDWANMEFMIDLSFLELIPIMLALYCSTIKCQHNWNEL